MNLDLFVSKHNRATYSRATQAGGGFTGRATPTRLGPEGAGRRVSLDRRDEGRRRQGDAIANGRHFYLYVDTRLNTFQLAAK
jgi:hypothetical protein